MSSKESPAITKSEFDGIAPELRRDLERWWEAEKEDVEEEKEQQPADPETDGLWEGIPEIDSKSVVKASPIVRRHLGVDLDPQHIKKGGYASFDELIDDLFPKLRASCPDTSPPNEPTEANQGASPND